MNVNVDSEISSRKVEQPPVEPEEDKKKDKVEVRLQAVCDAPILKQKNFKSVALTHYYQYLLFLHAMKQIRSTVIQTEIKNK